MNIGIISKYHSITEARDVLRTHREQNIRQSQKVVDLWESVLKDHVDKLGDESKHKLMNF